MHVRPHLRHQLQLAKTKPEFEATLTAIHEAGSTTGPTTAQLPDLPIPTPTGPIELW